MGNWYPPRTLNTPKPISHSLHTLKSLFGVYGTLFNSNLASITDCDGIQRKKARDRMTGRARDARAHSGVLEKQFLEP